MYIFSLEMVLQKQRLAELQEFKKKLEKNLEDELGDDYILDLKKNYDLPDDIKYDIIPEFWNGRNIADFIHAELLQVKYFYIICISIVNLTLNIIIIKI